MACFITVTILWVFSVCLHEFGHAIVAYYGGDVTVEEKGYLTLNPLAYTHPLLSILMPVVFLLLGGIGLPGGAVYINDHLLRSRRWETAVALAGPAMNLLLTVALAIPFHLGWIPADPANGMAISLAFLMVLQISALMLNLLPIPPLDGFRAISPWLSRETQTRLLAQSNVLILGVFLLLWYVPVANRMFWGTVWTIAWLCGVDPELAREGWQTFRFWD